jgi:hypothetical protein
MFHVDQRDRDSLTLDAMEALRPLADAPAFRERARRHAHRVGRSHRTARRRPRSRLRGQLSSQTPAANAAHPPQPPRSARPANPGSTRPRTRRIDARSANDLPGLRRTDPRPTTPLLRRLPRHPRRTTRRPRPRNRAGRSHTATRRATRPSARRPCRADSWCQERRTPACRPRMGRGATRPVSLHAGDPPGGPPAVDPRPHGCHGPRTALLLANPARQESAAPAALGHATERRPSALPAWGTEPSLPSQASRAETCDPAYHDVLDSQEPAVAASSAASADP